MKFVERGGTGPSIEYSRGQHEHCVNRDANLLSSGRLGVRPEKLTAVLSSQPRVGGRATGTRAPASRAGRADGALPL